MKLLYIANSIVPSRTANSVHVMKMCSAFSAAGHDVSLVLPKYDAGGYEPNVDDVFDYYGVPESFKIIQIPARYPAGRWSYLWGTLRLCLGLRRVCRSLNPDLVYGRYLPGCVIGIRQHKATIFEAHGPVWRSTVENLGFNMMCRSPYLQRIVLISDALKRLYRDQKELPESRYRVVHDAADVPSDTNSISNWPGRPGILQVGYFGSLYEGRGIELIVELSRLMPNVDFHLVGGDDGEVRAMKSRYMMENLFLHGHKSQKEVPAYQKRCDVLVAPYQLRVRIDGGGDTSGYMSPLKIFEYMASRRPMVVSDLPVLREVLSRDIALLVEPAAVEEWRGALERLHDPSLRETIAAAAYRQFEHHHSWSARVDQVLDGFDPRVTACHNRTSNSAA